jgi:chromosome segregation ATPase
VTPSNSREVALSLSRDRVARALSRLERLSRDATDTIHDLRSEKREIEQRLAELTKRFQVETNNFEQRAALLQSITVESEERARMLESLTAQQDANENLIEELRSNIARLEQKLSDGRSANGEAEATRQQLLTEKSGWQDKVGELNEKLEWVTKERDHFRTLLVDREREDAQWAIKLSPDEKENATRAIDSLMDKLSSIETRIAEAEKEEH